MAVSYKKKRFMYQYAKDILHLPVPGIRSCEYKFYRGLEWLEFSDSDYVCYKITFNINCNYIRFVKWVYDDDWNKMILCDRVIDGI